MWQALSETSFKLVLKVNFGVVCLFFLFFAIKISAVVLDCIIIASDF